MADVTIGIDSDTSGWEKGFKAITGDIKGFSGTVGKLFGGTGGGAGGVAGLAGGFGLNKFLSSDLAQSYASSMKLGVTDPIAPALLRHLDEARTDVGYEGEGASARDAQTIRRMADAAKMGDVSSAITLQRAGFGTDMDALIENPVMALAARSVSDAYLPDIDRSFQRRALDEMGLSHLHQGEMLGFQRRAEDRLNIDPDGWGNALALGDTATAGEAQGLWRLGQGISQFQTFTDRLAQFIQAWLESPWDNITGKQYSDSKSGEELKQRWELMPNE